MKRLTDMEIEDFEVEALNADGGPDSVADHQLRLIAEIRERREADGAMICAWCGQTRKRGADDDETLAIIREHIRVECPNNALGSMVKLLAMFLACFESLAEDENPAVADLAIRALAAHRVMADELPRERDAESKP
ncbi:MAG: hypothetical protein IT386_11560 [Deltaproteobacteria bacterium]|nr:hypothetical protein [Deltaproteobacteria bacterium]